MIAGLQIVPLRVISDDRGAVMHMLRADAPHFVQFGEVYFSKIFPGKVKAWHRHRSMVRNYAVPVGQIRLVLYDERSESLTRGSVQEIALGADDYNLVVIPPMVWSGFACIGSETA